MSPIPVQKRLLALKQSDPRTEWPTADIEQAAHSIDAQRASPAALQDAGAKSAETLKASCLTDTPRTPSARLKAVGKRLETMLQEVTLVRSALNDFYGSLSDEQKARFEAIGPKRTSQLESLVLPFALEGEPFGVMCRGFKFVGHC